MKKTIFNPILGLALFCSPILYAQDILWEKSFGGKNADYLMDAQPTADYGFILAGSSLSKKSGNKTQDNNGDLDYWIWKMDEKGDLDWQKNFGGSGSDFLQSIALTKDGGFILAGTSSSKKGFDKQDNNKGNDDFWIIKLDAKGNQEWQKTIGGNDQEKMQSIRQTIDGGYIIGGSSSSDKSGDKTMDGFGNLDYWIIKTDDKGVIKWQKCFGGEYSDELRSLTPTKDGGYLVGGYSNSPTSGNKIEDNKGIGDYWILKLDKTGEMVWQKTIGGNQDDQLYAICQTYDDNYIIGGNSDSDSSNEKNKNNENGTDFWVVKIDNNGSIIWQETYNIGKVDVLTSIIENADHTILLGGYAQSEVMGTSKKDKNEINDFVGIKITEKGEEVWRKSVGSAGEDILKKAVETRDGGYLLAGTSNAKVSKDKNSNLGSNDFWVVKLKDKTKPEKIKLVIEAMPNPTTSFANVIVGYDYEKGTASVYDLAGRQLQSFSITSRTVPIDLSNYPEGIYIVNIATNIQSDGVKIVKGLNKK